MNLLLQTRSAATCEHNGVRAHLAAGDLVVIDGAARFRLEMDRDYQQVLIQLPRDLICRRYEGLLRSAGVPLRAAEPNGRLVFEAVTAIASHLDGASHVGRTRAFEAVIGLLGAVYEATASTREEQRLARAFADIDANLADPEISASRLAALQGISRRRLDAIFAKHGLTVSRVLWQRRLERVASELASGDAQHQRIIDVALAWGFNSQAHFSRAFRSRFGVSPREFRYLSRPSDGHRKMT